MSVNEKIKTINHKIEWNKAQYDLDRQTAKISALSSVNISKYENLTGKKCFIRKRLARKKNTMKRLEYSRLGIEIKPQTNISKKLYQRLDNAFISNKDNNHVNESLFENEKKNLISQI